MKNLTYRQLLNAINDLPLDHLDDNVSIWDAEREEMTNSQSCEIITENHNQSDILDEGHLVIIIGL